MKKQVNMVVNLNWACYLVSFELQCEIQYVYTYYEHADSKCDSH